MVQAAMSILTPAPGIRNSLNIIAAQIFDMAFVEIKEFVGVISFSCTAFWLLSKSLVHRQN
jgi:hypothetical protein